MKDKKYYHIIAIFLLILIAISPVLAEEFKAEEKLDSKIDGEKLTNPNNIIVAKAATTNESNNDCCSLDNSTGHNDHSDNTNNTDSNNQNSNKLPSSDTGPKKLSQAQILKASVYVNNFVVKNKKLPNKVTIGGYDFSISEYSYLLSKTIYYKYNKKKTDVVVKYNIKNPPKPIGTKIKGKINAKQYSTYTKKLFKYIERNNRVPNYVNTKLGKMQYQTAVYGFNRALYWSYYHKNKLPTSLQLNIPKNHKMNKAIPNDIRELTFNVHSTIDLDNSSNGIFTTVKTKFTQYGPIQVAYNFECLISIGRCSCGKIGNYEYHETSFKNYCPYCKISGSLIYKEASAYPEGLWFCTSTYCGADFCLVTGKEHITKSPKYLTPC